MTTNKKEKSYLKWAQQDLAKAQKALAKEEAKARAFHYKAMLILNKFDDAQKRIAKLKEQIPKLKNDVNEAKADLMRVRPRKLPNTKHTLRGVR